MLTFVFFCWVLKCKLKLKSKVKYLSQIKINFTIWFFKLTYWRKILYLVLEMREYVLFYKENYAVFQREISKYHDFQISYFIYWYLFSEPNLKVILYLFTWTFNQFNTSRKVLWWSIISNWLFRFSQKKTLSMLNNIM